MMLLALICSLQQLFSVGNRYNNYIESKSSCLVPCLEYDIVRYKLPFEFIHISTF